MAPLQSSLLGGWKERTYLTLVTSIADGMHARAGRLALNARMADVRAAQLLTALPEGNFILIIKFLRENDEDWVLEDSFDPVRT